MKSRRIYFRKKGKAIAIEGKTPSNKSLHLYTLGTAEKHLLKLLKNADFFTQEKKRKISENLKRIAIKENPHQNNN